MLPDDEAEEAAESKFALDLAIIILDETDRFLQDLHDVRLNRDMRDRLVAISKDVRDFLIDWTEDEEVI